MLSLSKVCYRKGAVEVTDGIGWLLIPLSWPLADMFLIQSAMETWTSALTNFKFIIVE